MKRFKYSAKKILTLVFSLILLTSCNDFLEVDSKSKFTESGVFDNLDYATKQVTGIYQAMTEANLWAYTYFYAHCDNDIELLYANNNNGRVSIAHYDTNTGTSLLASTWNELYKHIERANIAIDNLPKSPIWTGEYEKEAKRLYGETLTLRALFYAELISYWGDVPFLVKSSQAGDDFNVPKTDRDSIYEYIINDLRIAEEYVPWYTEIGTTERITKSFVKGLRARLALAYAGYSIRNKTFETRRGRYWQDYYEIANQECRELMESGRHNLNPNFEQVFKNFHVYIQDLQYGEILYEIANGRLYSGLVTGCIGMAHSVNPPDPVYGRAQGEIRSHVGYYYSFDKNDKRRDVSVELYDYSQPAFAGKQRPLNNVVNFRPSKWRRSWISPSMGGDLKESQYTGVNWPLMRFSDVVLMFAETENEINGAPTQAAKEALMMVRKRAFPQSLWTNKVNHYVDSVSQSKESFFNAIVDERAWEFGGEMIRKNDLIRWNLLGDRLDKMRDNVDKILNHPNEPPYDNVPTFLFWKYKEDGETMEILNRDYRLPSTPIEGYTRTPWFGAYPQSNINSFYLMFNNVANGYDKTENNHLYYIQDEIILRSNGVLSNDQIP
jgi:hypothetical protein